MGERKFVVSRPETAEKIPNGFRALELPLTAMIKAVRLNVFNERVNHVAWMAGPRSFLCFIVSRGTLTPRAQKNHGN